MNRDELRNRNFVTVPEAVTLVFHGEVDERTIRKAIELGQLPGVKIGAKILIPVPPLLALLETPERPGDTPTPGVNADVVRAAINMIAAGLRVLEPFIEAGKAEVTNLHIPGGVDAA